MSSWLLSLRWVGRRGTALRRGLEKERLAAPRLSDGFLELGPCRAAAEPRAQIIHQHGNLRIVHAGGKARHDRAALALHRPHARQDGVGEVARIGTADPGGEAKVDAAIRRRPRRLMAI